MTGTAERANRVAQLRAERDRWRERALAAEAQLRGAAAPAPATAEIRVGALDADRRDAGDHDLPMLRVHRAWEAAEKIGAQNGVPQSVALDIAREVISIVGEGTRRWGHLCTQCRSLLVTKDGDLSCPKHGRLGAWTGATLLISFDPIESKP